MSHRAQTVRTIALSIARSSLSDLVTRVQRGKEYVILKKNGSPVAGIMDIDEFEDYLELRDPKAQRAIRKSTEELRAGKTRPAQELLAELDGERKTKARRHGRQR